MEPAAGYAVGDPYFSDEGDICELLSRQTSGPAIETIVNDSVAKNPALERSKI